jgi:hypothetical protein
MELIFESWRGKTRRQIEIGFASDRESRLHGVWGR